MEENWQDEIMAYPRSNDKLFLNDQPDWVNNAVIHNFTNRFSSYADGYIEAARNLVFQCLEKNQGLDLLVFPIIFLYRHYIELRLKELIVASNYCVNETKDFPSTHDILILWKEFKTLYIKIEDKIDDKFQNAEMVINEFATVDPKSMAFRYPVDKSGNPLLKMNLINLRNFAEVMERLHSFLDALSYQLADYMDSAQDMYSELYRDFYRDLY